MATILTNPLEFKTDLSVRKIIHISGAPNGNTFEGMNNTKNKCIEENKTYLFYNVESSLYTPTGKHRRTEFVLFAPEHNIDWRIECKYQKISTQLDARCLQEVQDCRGITEKKFVLLLGGALLNKENLNRIKENIDKFELTDFVWYGGLDDFKIYLKNFTT
jgi:hypothetical protein